MHSEAPNSVFDGLLRSKIASGFFGETHRLQAMLDVEAALAKAEADIGVIPADAVKPITDCCRAERFDIYKLSVGVTRSGNLAIPLVKLLTEAVRVESPQAAAYVHWGATSQDVVDTGLVLQLRDFLEWQDRELGEFASVLALLVERFRYTPMAGRTWLQHAVPVTFGLKAAGWLDAVLRHRERLVQMKARVFVLQFGGAAGTLASLGERGIAVSEVLAQELGLGLPDIAWHASRDRVAEVATFQGLLMGTLGKIARDLSLLGQTEIAEVAESLAEGRGGSSTMPHKRNPVTAAAVLSSAIRVPGLVSTMLSAMLQEQERGLGGWHAEWETLPELCSLTAGALENLSAEMKGLQVFPDKMDANLGATRGLLFAEAVSMALAEAIGKAEAHALIEAASHRAIAQEATLLSVLEVDTRVTEHLSRQRLRHLFKPAQYLGSTQSFIARVLHTQSREAKGARESLTAQQEPHRIGLHFLFDWSPGKPVLVLSNSLGTSLDMWADQVEAFSEHFSLLRYDSRGHGSSEVPAGPYTIEQMGRDVLALMDHLGIERAHFCGLSMGGMVAQWLGSRAPERLYRLVMSNTAAKIGTVEGWNQRIAAVEQGGMTAIVPAVLERWFTEQFRSTSGEVVNRAKAMLLSTSAKGYTACCAAIRDMDQRENIEKISAPTLVVFGVNDRVTTGEDASLLLQRIPNSESLALQAAHLSNAEANGDFTRGVLQFLLS